MSKYSGKCDFRDTLEINFNDNWENFKNRATVYHYLDIQGSKEKLEFTSPADLIPWYTYLIASMGCEKNGPCTINLSQTDYLDEKINSFKECGFNIEYLEKNKQTIKDLYIIESNKPIEEQGII